MSQRRVEAAPRVPIPEFFEPLVNVCEAVRQPKACPCGTGIYLQRLLQLDSREWTSKHPKIDASRVLPVGAPREAEA